MNPNIMPSSEKILWVLRNAGGLSIPALASGSLVTPGVVRSDVFLLESKGLAKVDPEENVVRITPRGIEFLKFRSEPPRRSEISLGEAANERVPMDNLELEAALDEAVSKLQR